jgi:hypothetical protein
MPELMIRYRAAAFFSRLYAPEITMGMQTREEIIDVVGEVVNDPVVEINPDEPMMKRNDQPEMKLENPA